MNVESATQLAVGDVNEDGHIDIITSDASSQDINIFLGLVTTGDEFDGFSEALKVEAEHQSKAFALDDLNGDGHSDIVTAGSNQISVFLGDGFGRFSSSEKLLFEASAIALGDLNGDGYVDLIRSQENSEVATAHFGNGNGTFKVPVGLADIGQVISLRDINSDGRLDLITKAQVLLQEANGAFSYVTPLPILAHSAVVTDINGDGVADLVTATGSGVQIRKGAVAPEENRSHYRSGTRLADAKWPSCAPFNTNDDLDPKSVQRRAGKSKTLPLQGDTACRVDRLELDIPTVEEAQGTLSLVRAATAGIVSRQIKDVAM